MKTYTLKMTTQRQVTYPKELLEQMGLKAGEAFLVTLVDPIQKILKIQSAQEFFQHIGSNLRKTTQTIPSKKTYRQELAQHLSQKYQKSLEQ